jgi:hypothetical protein
MPVFFNDTEWAFVNAAVDRLIPADAHGPGGVEASVPVFIDRQLNMPYAHDAYFYMQGRFHFIRMHTRHWGRQCVQASQLLNPMRRSSQRFVAIPST